MVYVRFGIVAQRSGSPIPRQCCPDCNSDVIAGFGADGLLSAGVSFIFGDSSQYQITNLCRKSLAAREKLAPDLLEGKFTVRDEHGRLVGQWTGLTGIDARMMKAPTRHPRKRPLQAFLVVAKLETMNPTAGLIPHNEVEIVIVNPAPIQIVLYRS